MICVVNFGAGNVKSIVNAFEILGCDTILSNSKEDILNASKLVIPGVGSYHLAMKALHESGLIPALETCRSQGKPILGICLGMQLLSSTGTEGGNTQGLGWIPGEVVKLTPKNLKVPHVGWNEVASCTQHPVLQNIHQNDKTFYFVHSYQFVPEDPTDIIGTSEYGSEFVSVVAKDNIVATQFHPEKSQENGLKLIENFSEWTP